jgi:hypothetical protein
MNKRSTVVTVTLLTAAAIPSWGQTVRPAAESASGGTPSIAFTPDFSGMWAHPYVPGFEPPPSGPGPVMRRVVRLPSGIISPAMVGDYTNPILKPQAAEVVKKRGEMELSGLHAPHPHADCWPQGVPFAFFNYAMQMLQQPHQITILYPQNNEVRHVRMNQSHPVQLTPSWQGDSVGHYQGDMLVIDTVGIKSDRPLAMVDFFGTPHTQALHVVERYRLIDYEAAKEALQRIESQRFQPNAPLPDPNYKGKHLQLEFTVEDDGVFTTPWSATVTYGRGLDWQEYICAENPDISVGGKEAVPHVDKPDF